MKNGNLIYIDDGRKNPFNTSRYDFVNGRSDTRTAKQKRINVLRNTNLSGYQFKVNGQRGKA